MPATGIASTRTAPSPGSRATIRAPPPGSTSTSPAEPRPGPGPVTKDARPCQSIHESTAQRHAAPLRSRHKSVTGPGPGRVRFADTEAFQLHRDRRNVPRVHEGGEKMANTAVEGLAGAV